MYDITCEDIIMEALQYGPVLSLTVPRPDKSIDPKAEARAAAAKAAQPRNQEWNQESANRALAKYLGQADNTAQNQEPPPSVAWPTAFGYGPMAAVPLRPAGTAGLVDMPPEAGTIGKCSAEHRAAIDRLSEKIRAAHTAPPSDVRGLGKVYVEYGTAEEAQAAARGLAGRLFAGRLVLAGYLDEARFNAGLL